MRPLLVALALVLSSSVASAAPKRVGILVLGDALKGPTANQTEKWLREHNLQIVTTPMPADAVKTLENCFVIDDPKCARAIVDARSTAESVIAIRIEVASKKGKELRLTIDWFVKGHSPVTARRNCDDCSEAVLRTTIDAMLGDLAKQSPGFMGRVKVLSDPPGIAVLLDNQTIGVTPIEHSVSAGAHKARLVKDGRMGDEKTINVEPGATAEIKLLPPAAQVETPPPPPPPPPPGGERPSRVFPTILITVGLVGAGVGAGMYIIGGPTGDAMEYTDLRTPGTYTMIGGGVVAVAGVIWILATRSSSGPTVAMTPGGATIGWTGRF